MSEPTDPKSIFLICKVRDIPKTEQEILDWYVAETERSGTRVHYPSRDTVQEDSIGLYICRQNRDAIARAGEVRIYYNPTSQGSMFDLGMTYMASKPLRIINPESLDGGMETPVSRFLYWYAFDGQQPDKSVAGRRGQIRRSAAVTLRHSGNTPDFLFDFGMVFMAGKPLVLLNRDEVKPTPSKSFENVLLALHNEYRLLYRKR